MVRSKRNVRDTETRNDTAGWELHKLSTEAEALSAVGMCTVRLAGGKAPPGGARSRTDPNGLQLTGKDLVCGVQRPTNSLSCVPVTSRGVGSTESAVTPASHPPR